MSQIVATIHGETISVSLQRYDATIIDALCARKARKRGSRFELALSVLNLRLLQQLGAQMLPHHAEIARKWLEEAERYKQALSSVPQILCGDIDVLQEFGYTPKIAPYKHQRVGVSLMVHLHYLGLFLDCGAGKTGTVLLFLDLLQKHVLRRPVKALVAGKLMSLYSGWKEDCSKFTDLTCDVLWEPTSTETKVLNRVPIPDDQVDPGLWGSPRHFVDKKPGVVARSYTTTLVFDQRTGRVVFLSKRSEFKPKLHEKRKIVWRQTEDGEIIKGSVAHVVQQHRNLRKESISDRIAKAAGDDSTALYVINHDGARMFAEDLAKVPWDVVVIDESTMIKNHKSKLFKALCGVALHVPYKFILSGTPAPNGPVDLWSQLFFLDRGITLGDNVHLFLEKHFTKVPMKMGGNEFTEWRANEHTLQWVAARLQNRHYRVALRDCADLPPLTVQVVDVYMTTEQRKAYEEMHEDLITQIKDHTIEAKTALTKLIKLRQITGGFVFPYTGAEPVAITPNPKLDTFVEFVNDLLLQKEQVVVFAVHVEEIRAILQAIPGSVGVYGEIKDEQKFKNIEDFRNGKAPVVVCQPQSAAHALTFVNARYLLFYSIDYSAELNYQAIKRIERIVQKRAMFVYYFLMHASIDRTIYRVIGQKVKAQASLIDGLSGDAASALRRGELDDVREIVRLLLTEPAA